MFPIWPTLKLSFYLWDFCSSTPNTSRPTLTLKTQGKMTTRSSGPDATLAILRGDSNDNGLGGVKAECSNCGATHIPLWRRGLNDELNCNNYGLYCKLVSQSFFSIFKCENSSVSRINDLDRRACEAVPKVKLVPRVPLVRNP